MFILARNSILPGKLESNLPRERRQGTEVIANRRGALEFYS